MEHSNTKLIPSLYRVLGMVYTYTKLVVYIIGTIVLGIPVMFISAVVNGLAVALLVWVWGPVLKLWMNFFHAFLPLLTGPCVILFTPLVDVLARLLRQCRVQVKANVENKKQQHVA